MNVTETRDRFFEIGAADIEAGGVWYDVWTPDKDFNESMHMVCSQVPERVKGANCTSWPNSIRCRMGLEGIGGTAAYNANSVWWFWETFDVRKNYPPFTVLISKYGGVALEDQGHKAVVFGWEDYESREQQLISSDAADGLSADGTWGSPGPNLDRYMASSHYVHGYEWAGVVVDQPVLDGFPGFTADLASARALWTADCMEQLGTAFGIQIPRFYFAMMSLTELSHALHPNPGYEDIRDAPGYLSAVDHDSRGPGQMRAMYWPMPESFTVTVACFARALADEAYRTGTTSLPTDRQGAAEFIQSIWKSYDPTGSNYAANFGLAQEITQYAGAPAPTPEPEPAPRLDPISAKFGYYRFESAESWNLEYVDPKDAGK